jgi:Winged helix DNA-binding domain
MSATDVLTRRQLNRALLARQLLLEPVPVRGVIDTVEHLVGLQAQAPFPPYYGLWSRIDGFRPDDLATLINDRDVVRIALMRGTIHLVSAQDCLPLRHLMQPVLDRAFRTNHGKRLTGVDHAELAALGRELVDAAPMTFSELGEALAERWPGNPPADLAQGVRALVPLVQIPPRAIWGKAGQSRHTSAESWLGRGPARAGSAADLDAAGLVRRYLAAFGPATVRDIQAWSGLTGLRAAVDTLGPDLVTFRDESGAELYDLPEAPRPPADTVAPVRLVAEFDNLVLSHADRTRIITEEHRGRLYSINGIFPGTVLLDGFAAGMWRITTARKTATLTIELWENTHDKLAVTREAERLLAFAAPGTAHELRFEALTARLS